MIPPENMLTLKLKTGLTSRVKAAELHDSQARPRLLPVDKHDLPSTRHQSIVRESISYLDPNILSTRRFNDVGLPPVLRQSLMNSGTIYYCPMRCPMKTPPPKKGPDQCWVANAERSQHNERRRLIGLTLSRVKLSDSNMTTKRPQLLVGTFHSSARKEPTTNNLLVRVDDFRFGPVQASMHKRRITESKLV